jgi:tRNA(Ile)-lysidine synthase
MFGPGDSIGVAVSGGADSVALLRILEDLRSELGITLCVLHLNHQLRGLESDGDEAFVKALAEDCGLQCFATRHDVAGEAKRHGWNLEDAGRRLRSEFFIRVLREGNATRIATAHTADDQAETVLARIIRGTGLTGLGSIQPMKVRVVRPLLDVRRNALRDYLAARRQEWREDASNRDLHQTRARLRHQLLPQLERDFSPAIVEKLCNLSSLARDEESFWVAFIEDRFEHLVTESPSGFSIRASDLLSPMRVSSTKILSEGNPILAVTQRLIRHMHSCVAGAQGQLSRKDVERVIHLAARAHSGRRLELPGHVRVERVFDSLVFLSEGARKKAPGKQRISSSIGFYEHEVRLPETGSTTVSIPELGRSFRLKLIDWSMRERDTRWDKRVLDAERLSAPLVIRNWRPGDAYLPCGRRQPRKLKRMFLAGRVAATERALWPVLTSAGKVAWAQRMPVAAEFSADETTRIGLWITEDGQAE